MYKISCCFFVIHDIITQEKKQKLLLFDGGGGGGGGGWGINCQSSQTSCKPQNKVQEYTLA